MRTTTLGSSDIRVSVVGMGTMGLGGAFAPDCTHDEDVIRRLREGMDLGMTLIDTAEIYGGGHAEELVGKAMAGQRQRAVVATKFSPEHSSRREVFDAAERSLRRLSVDAIDLYQTHWPNPAVPFEETLGAMGRLLEEGKVRTVGLSNATCGQWQLAVHAFPAGTFVSLQQQYNLADRFAEAAMLPVCRQEGLTLIAYSPLLEGRLAPQDRRRRRLDELAQRVGCSTSQLVLAWLLGHPAVVVIPKAADSRHLAENAAAGLLSLDADIVQQIADLYAPDLIQLAADEIHLEEVPERIVYRTLEDALANTAGLCPSPSELAKEYLAGEPFRPIKVREDRTDPRRYVLLEGRLRYWAWIIAHDGREPLPCIQV